MIMKLFKIVLTNGVLNVFFTEFCDCFEFSGTSIHEILGSELFDVICTSIQLTISIYKNVKILK